MTTDIPPKTTPGPPERAMKDPRQMSFLLARDEGGTMTRNAEQAIVSWNQGQRRRATAASVERFADGVAATGGLILTNAALSLGIGMPAGRAGVGLGASLLAAGIAWMTRVRRSGKGRPQPAIWVAQAPSYYTV